MNGLGLSIRMLARRFETETDFEYYIARRLRKEGFVLEENPAIKGVRPDIIVKSPNGHSIILELKLARGGSFDIRAALGQARMYQEITGANQSFVVVPTRRRANPSKGVFSAAEIPRVLRSTFESLKMKRKKLIKTSRTKHRVFCAVPFKESYDDVFSVAMTYAARRNGATAERVKDRDFVGDINSQIRKMIRNSIAVIADVSESNPNVLYELGYAHAREVPSVLICNTSSGRFPFDIRNLNILPYKKGQTNKIKKRLARRLASALS